MNSRSFLVADSRLRNRMLNEGHRIHPARWQGIDISTRPDAEMVELLNVDLDVDLRGIASLEHWRQEIQPNLPWADRHFEERVCGAPINPGVEWANWPWAKSAGGFISGGMFNHNYMERYWPRQAGTVGDPTTSVAEWNELAPPTYRDVHRGIRGEYGDLNSVVDLMLKDPLTRQAYLPIFFPEDTGTGDGGRKPCTLGYQFIMRDNLLHVYYPMRSCDLLRHFRDDCYLTVRLALWMLEELNEQSAYSAPWKDVRLGTLQMHMTSLHCFIGDYLLMRRDNEAELMKALS
jgi:hypothetical protein